MNDGTVWALPSYKLVYIPMSTLATSNINQSYRGLLNELSYHLAIYGDHFLPKPVIYTSDYISYLCHVLQY